MHLSPELKDAGNFDYQASGHKFGRVENVSPNGSTLGNATSPRFELIDSRTLKASELTADPAVDTSINSHFGHSRGLDAGGLASFLSGTGAVLRQGGVCDWRFR